MLFDKISTIKSIFIITFIIALLIGLLHIANAIIYSKKIQYINVPFRSSKINSGLSGFKAVFISDTHQIKKKDLDNIVDHINSEIKPDIVLLGGDFPNRDAVYRTMESLGKISNQFGIYGVEGNHDIRLQLKDAMAQNGITFLANEGLKISDNLFLAGSEDLWIGEPDTIKATEGSSEDDFVLLLAHNPDISMVEPVDNVDLILSGHTHGGHITFFGLWAPALQSKLITEFGQRFRSGMSRGNGDVPVYVSNGTGYYGSIPRIFARPQVVILELFPE